MEATGNYQNLLQSLTENTTFSGSFSNLVSFIIFVAAIAARYMIFENCGEAGWKAIIPLYNKFVYAKLSNNIKAAVIYIICCIMSFVFTFIGAASITISLLAGGAGGNVSYTAPVILFLIGLIALIGSLCASFHMYNGFVHAIGKSSLFTVLYMLIPRVAEMIIGFTSKKWQYDGFSNIDMPIIHKQEYPSENLSKRQERDIYKDYRKDSQMQTAEIKQQQQAPVLQKPQTSKSIKAKCPKCGAAMHSADNGLLQCSGCGAKFRPKPAQK